MDKQEFNKKLLRSLFLITAVAALSLALSSRNKPACAKAEHCAGCEKLEGCSQKNVQGL